MYDGQTELSKIPALWEQAGETREFLLIVEELRKPGIKAYTGRGAHHCITNLWETELLCI